MLLRKGLLKQDSQNHDNQGCVHATSLHNTKSLPWKPNHVTGCLCDACPHRRAGRQLFCPTKDSHAHLHSHRAGLRHFGRLLPSEVCDLTLKSALWISESYSLQRILTASVRCLSRFMYALWICDRQKLNFHAPFGTGRFAFSYTNRVHLIKLFTSDLYWKKYFFQLTQHILFSC